MLKLQPPQNHIMAQIGRDLKDHEPPLPQAGLPTPTTSTRLLFNTNFLLRSRKISLKRKDPKTGCHIPDLASEISDRKERLLLPACQAHFPYCCSLRALFQLWWEHIADWYATCLWSSSPRAAAQQSGTHWYWCVGLFCTRCGNSLKFLLVQVSSFKDVTGLKLCQSVYQQFTIVHRLTECDFCGFANTGDRTWESWENAINCMPCFLLNLQKKPHLLFSHRLYSFNYHFRHIKYEKLKFYKYEIFQTLLWKSSTPTELKSSFISIKASLLRVIPTRRNSEILLPCCLKAISTWNLIKEMTWIIPSHQFIKMY